MVGKELLSAFGFDYYHIYGDHFIFQKLSMFCILVVDHDSQ